jgi:hypothetical protein
MGQLELYRQLYDFCVWVLHKTEGFPRAKRLSVGLRIENALMEALVIVNGFNFAKATMRDIDAVSRRWDEVKLLLHLCYDLKLISKDSFAYALEKAGGIGDLIGGFRKSILGSRAQRG